MRTTLIAHVTIEHDGTATTDEIAASLGVWLTQRHRIVIDTDDGVETTLVVADCDGVHPTAL